MARAVCIFLVPRRLHHESSTLFCRVGTKSLGECVHGEASLAEYNLWRRRKVFRSNETQAYLPETLPRFRRATVHYSLGIVVRCQLRLVLH